MVKNILTSPCSKNEIIVTLESRVVKLLLDETCTKNVVFHPTLKHFVKISQITKAGKKLVSS